VQGIDQFLPVDLYVAGCPPRPDNLLNALIQIQDKIGRTKVSDFKNLNLPDLNVIQNN
jgi:NADH-quinone oxidoreductase subunit B